MKAATTFGGFLVLSAATLTLGCKSAPAQPASTSEAAAMSPPAAVETDLSDVTALKLLDTASAEMGGPSSYALTLITSADDLPPAVADRGLNVDFEVHDVVLVGMGELPTSGYAAEITGVQQVGQTVFVQARFEHPPADAMVNQVITTPWAAATIYKRKPGVTLRSDFE